MILVSAKLLASVRDARLTLYTEGGQGRQVLGTPETGLCLDIRRGEHTVIFGPNGAGKSTLLRLLRGELWLDPQGGSVHWHTAQGAEDAPLAGRGMAALVSAAQQERYMRQGWDMSGEDLLYTGLADTPLLYTAPAEAQKRLVRRLAQDLRITGLLSRPINTLSQGQLRILLLGRALLHGGETPACADDGVPCGPPLLLLDEYTDGLDAATRAHVLGVLRQAARHCTIVMTAHRADTVPAWAQRRLYLDGGLLHTALPPAYAGGGERPSVSTPATRPATPAAVLAALAVDAPALVQLHHATIYVDRTPVLHDIDWTWRQGEHWLIHGGNGAGKSTLLRLLAGDEYPALGGAITRHLPRHGGDVADLERIRRGVRMVSDQLQACYAYDLTGLELVLTGFDNSIGLYRTAQELEEEEALRWMHVLRVTGLTRRRISTLSTGQMRRLLLARALIGSPDILLLDEPCSGLDAPSRLELLRMLQELTEQVPQAQPSVHIALVSHHTADHIPALNRRARMDKGSLHIEV